MFSNIKEINTYKQAKQIIKTRLCKNLHNCTYGDACHYAHSIADVVIVNCAYEDKCIFIKNEPTENKCYNSDNGKICFFKHPNETVQEYHKRVGNIKTKNNEDTIKISPIKIQLDNKNVKKWTQVVNSKNVIMEDDYDSPTHVKASEIVNIIEDILDQQIKKVTLIIDYD